MFNFIKKKNKLIAIIYIWYFFSKTKTKLSVLVINKNKKTVNFIESYGFFSNIKQLCILFGKP